MARELDFSDGFTNVAEPTQGTFLLDDGTAGAPAVRFALDTNTGLYRIGDDILGWSTGGSERMRLDDSGQLGIGGTPSVRLHVIESDSSALVSGNSVAFFERNGDAVLTIGSPNINFCAIQFADPESNGNGRITYDHLLDSMEFRTNGAIAFTIDSSQQFGIGVTLPDSLVHIQAADASAVVDGDTVLHVEDTGNCAIQISSGAAGFGALLFGDSGDANIGAIQYDHSANDMEFRTNDVVAITIDSSQQVGIGVASPGAFVHIQDSDGSAVVDGNTVLLVEASGSCGIQISSGSGTFGVINFGDDGASNIGLIKYRHNTNHMELTTNSVIAVDIDDAQNVLFRQVASLVHSSVSSLTGSGSTEVSFPSSETDTDSAHPVAGSTFTCPTGLGGMYYIGFSVATASQAWTAGQIFQPRVERSGVVIMKAIMQIEANATRPLSIGRSGVFALSAGQTVKIIVFHNGTTVALNGNRELNYLSVTRIANS